MATAESVAAKLKGLISTANATTGKTDADLTTAINSLISGFGGGSELNYDEGEFTLDSEVVDLKTINGIPHQLGEPPVLCSSGQKKCRNIRKTIQIREEHR